MGAEEYYDEIASSYEELYGEEQREKIEEILKRIRLKRGEIMLDAGCGTCLLSEHLKGFIVSIDISEEMIKRGKGLRILANVEALPFSNRCFDKVIAITSLQDVENKERALMEIKRVCRGEIIISIPQKSKLIEQFHALCSKAKVEIVERFEAGKDMCFVCK